MVFFRIPLGGGHWVFGFTVLVIFEIGFSVFLSEERSDELIEIANRGWPLNTGRYVRTTVTVAIFRCGIKGQRFKVCEFAILIIMFGGFQILSNFHCSFSVFT